MIKIYFRDCSMWLAAIDELVDMGVQHIWYQDRLDLRGRYKIVVDWSLGD